MSLELPGILPDDNELIGNGGRAFLGAGVTDEQGWRYAWNWGKTWHPVRTAPRNMQLVESAAATAAQSSSPLPRELNRAGAQQYRRTEELGAAAEVQHVSQPYAEGAVASETGRRCAC